MPIGKLTGQERLRATQAAAALRRNATASAEAPTTAPAAKPDAVTISAAAKSLSAARKAVAAIPDVREDRVSALKAALASGTYAINSRQLAADIAKHQES